MRLRTAQNFFIDKINSDGFSKKDIIDRTGYVPLDLNYYNLLLSGLKLTKARDELYSYEYNQIKDAFENGSSISDITSNTTLQKRYNSKVELDDLLKSKILKYNEAHSYSEKVSNLRDRFVLEQKIKFERQDAINEYIASQKNKSIE